MKVTAEVVAELCSVEPVYTKSGRNRREVGVQFKSSGGSHKPGEDKRKLAKAAVSLAIQAETQLKIKVCSAFNLHIHLDV